MFDHVSQLTGVTRHENGAWQVDFWVCPRAALEAVAEDQDEEQDLEELTFYTVDLEPDEEGFSIGLEDDLADCFGLLEEHETGEGLAGDVRVRWETAALAEMLLQALIESNVLGFWPVEEDED